MLSFCGPKLPVCLRTDAERNDGVDRRKTRARLEENVTLRLPHRTRETTYVLFRISGM